MPRGDELHPLKEVFLCPALATSGSAPVSNLLIFPLKDPKYPCAFGFTAEALVVYLHDRAWPSGLGLSPL